jgi:hypothetical protein
MVTRLKNEPAVFLGLVQAILAVLVSFGLDLSSQQVGGLVALSAAGTAFLVRQNVAPIARPADSMPAAAPATTPQSAQGLVATG